MIGFVAWIVLGAVAIAAILAVHEQFKDRREKRHEYRMRRLEYDEKALGDVDDSDDDEPERDSPPTRGAWLRAQCAVCFRTHTSVDDMATAVIDDGGHSLTVPVCDRRRCRREAEAIGTEMAAYEMRKGVT